MGGGTKAVQTPYQNQNNYSYYTPQPTQASEAVKDFTFDDSVLRSGVNSAFGRASRSIDEGASGYQSTGNPILDERMKQVGQTQNAAARSGVLGDANLQAQIAKYGKTLDYARLMSPQLVNSSSSGYGTQVVQQPSIWSSILGAGAQVGSAALLACDENLKENFQPVSTADAMRIVAAVPMEEWNYKGTDPSIRSIGPRAQAVQAVLPTAVRALDESGTLGLDPITMIGIQWAAIQELIKQNAAMQEAISSLRQDAAIIGANHA